MDWPGSRSATILFRARLISWASTTMIKTSTSISGAPLILVLVFIIVVDAQLIKRALNRLVAERLPGQSTKGLTMYAVMRALQIRRFRIPVPRVQPGDKI